MLNENVKEQVKAAAQLLQNVSASVTIREDQSAPPMTEPSHSEILFQLGELKGQMGSILLLMDQKRDDINAIFARISLIEKTAATNTAVAEAASKVAEIEKQLARWAGVILCVAFLSPLIVPQVQKLLDYEVNEITRPSQAKP